MNQKVQKQLAVLRHKLLDELCESAPRRTRKRRSAFRSMTLSIGGVDVGTLELRLTRIADVIQWHYSKHGVDRDEAHLMVVGLFDSLLRSAANDLLARFVHDEYVNRKVLQNPDAIFDALAVPGIGYQLLALPSVQQFITLHVDHPAAVERFSKQLTRGLRERVYYKQNAKKNRGRKRKPEIDPSVLTSARRDARDVWDTATDLKALPISRRRLEYRRIVEQYLPGLAVSARDQLAEDLLTFPPKEIGRQVASLRHHLPKRRI